MIEVYNSSSALVFRGSEAEFEDLKKDHLVTRSDRVIIK